MKTFTLSFFTFLFVTAVNAQQHQLPTFASSTSGANNKTSYKKADTLLVLNQAYMLAEPNWKSAAVVHLKPGCLVILDYSTKGWAFVKLIENIANPTAILMQGFVKNQVIGLDARGVIDHKRISKAQNDLAIL